MRVMIFCSLLIAVSFLSLLRISVADGKMRQVQVGYCAEFEGD